MWRSSRIVPAGVTIAIQPAALKSGIMDGHAIPPRHDKSKSGEVASTVQGMTARHPELY
jgi:hypothetical protein